ncbi:MAG: hypothetical protein CL816_07570 [Coxiellaceae bacterium]|nr:hypothetical protein [Coxiellaceae bacterium]
MTSIKKKPDRITSCTDLEDYYWLKTELLTTCKRYDLCTQGLKQELETRLKVFFQTGQTTTARKKTTRIS